MGKERGVREKLERTLGELRANSGRTQGKLKANSRQTQGKLKANSRRTQGEGRANVERRKSERIVKGEGKCVILKLLDSTVGAGRGREMCNTENAWQYSRGGEKCVETEKWCIFAI